MCLLLARIKFLWPDHKKSKMSAQSVFELIDRKSKIDPFDERGLKPDSVVGNIRFENVHFSYPSRPDIQILKGFTLDCKPNETNALVGPSGFISILEFLIFDCHFALVTISFFIFNFDF